MVEIIIGLICLIVGLVSAVVMMRLLNMQSMSQARQQAEQIREQANATGQTLAKQIELDARNEQAKRRQQFETEIDTARNELQKAERKVSKREDNLDRKLDTLTTKEKYLDDLNKQIKAREKVVTASRQELDTLIENQRNIVAKTTEQQKQKLLAIAHLSEDEAKKLALQLLEQQCQHEASQIIQRTTERAEEESKQKSREIVLNAIQRYASEHTADATVSAIPITSDDMKGRIIGREGRNIRAFEKATGVDVIVDDTPGVVVVSCFDPVRRAIAAESLNKLLEDGRIHPSRIEELVSQVGNEMQDRIVKYGNEAAIEVNVQGLHPKISEMMGRMHYRMSYGQNILRHSIEVAYLCQSIADQLNLDGAMARRCGFLHDLGKAMDHEVEGGHPQIGMDFARKYSEDAAVLNAIGGHHNDIPATTPYTPIVMAADAISGARPGARRETLERYVQRLEQLEQIATNHEGVKQAYAIQAGREVRVIVDPDSIDDTKCTYIARTIAQRVSDEMTFPGEIRVTVLRELRTVDYAR